MFRSPLVCVSSSNGCGSSPCSSLPAARATFSIWRFRRLRTWSTGSSWMQRRWVFSGHSRRSARRMSGGSSSTPTRPNWRVSIWIGEIQWMRRNGVQRNRATRSSSGSANRRALRAATDGRPIFDAWSDEPWVVECAAVRVSLVCFSGGSDGMATDARLNGQAVDEIHADLTASVIEPLGPGVVEVSQSSLPEFLGCGIVAGDRVFGIAGYRLAHPLDPFRWVEPAVAELDQAPGSMVTWRRVPLREFR